jgi:hypothetical protein
MTATKAAGSPGRTGADLCAAPMHDGSVRLSPPQGPACPYQQGHSRPLWHCRHPRQGNRIKIPTISAGNLHPTQPAAAYF